MEDESEGWEIQEYSPSGGDGKIMTTRTRMIRGGLRIGKTIIVTGVVLSSAPFVLPPLIVVSAVGLACSVPFGVFVASYACTEKLMSKLLPMPRPPPPLPLMLDYKGFSQEDEVSYFDPGSERDIYKDEVEEEEDQLMGETEADLESRIPLRMSEDLENGGVDMEKEEERLIQDTKATVEMRIALPVGEEREAVPEVEYYDGKAREEERKVEEGYEEDDEDLTQVGEQLPAITANEISVSEIHPLVEILRQERPVDNVKVDDPNLAQKTHEDVVCEVVEVEGPYGLTIGAIEQTTVGKKAGDADQGEQSTIDIEGSFEDKRYAGEAKKDNGGQFTAKRRTIKVDNVHNIGVEGRADMSGTLETAVYTPSEQITRKPECELAKTKDKKAEQNINITPINVEVVGGTQYPKKQNSVDQHVEPDAINTTKRKKKSKKKKPASGETATEGATLFHPEQKEGAISTTAHARCISDQSRFNMVDDKNKPGEEVRSSKKAAGIVHQNEPGTTSRTPSGRSLRASPKKALFSEEKIWDNIEALRTIVGYKVARHGTCMEELKALYIFTGVEPPMSFNSSADVRDSPDLVEVNDMLRILMAIVGVK
ncbi:unnamed protein product [Rhodiola kirilowii]